MLLCPLPLLSLRLLKMLRRLLLPSSSLFVVLGVSSTTALDALRSGVDTPSIVDSGTGSSVGSSSGASTSSASRYHFRLRVYRPHPSSRRPSFHYILISTTGETLFHSFYLVVIVDPSFRSWLVGAGCTRFPAALMTPFTARNPLPFRVCSLYHR